MRSPSGASSRVARVNEVLRTVREMRDPRLRPWRRTLLRSLAGVALRDHRVGCNICGWHGADFQGGRHSESAACPSCGSVSRDRFLYHCWVRRTPPRAGVRLLETSPRLGAEYRRQMAHRVSYLCSDYDERAHRAGLHLDLQDLALPDASLDVILTAHVLEHVPDTGRALAEMERVLEPGGVAFVMVPVPQGQTAPPTEPEYHGDQTLVYWRFGWDFVEQARKAGFEVATLVTADLLRRVQTNDPWEYGGADVDVASLLAAAPPYVEEMVAVADDRESAWLGTEPSFFFIVWECRKPA